MKEQSTHDDLVRDARRFSYEGSRPEVQALVPTDARRILDLGCASGILGAALKERQEVEVVGVEYDPVYAEGAAARLDRVVCDDLEQLALRDDLETDFGRFDCLVAADVLEHLRDPWAVLKTFAALVEPGKTVVISLPNVRFWETFWQLGRHGTWPRRYQGIFDHTHLRWFTGLDAVRLLEQAGVEFHTVHRVMRLGRKDSRGDSYARFLERTPLRPFFTFQHVIAGARR